LAELNTNYASACIEFFLATVTPSGHCFSGINRVESPVYENIGFNDHLFNTVLIHYNRRNYLNLYFYKTLKTTLGFADQPSQVTQNLTLQKVINEKESVVVSAETLANGTFAKTVTHEIGHWLDLFHVWGPDNNSIPSWVSCHQPNDFNGDFVSDTNPMTISFSDHNCQRNSCNPTLEDPLDNYMSYSFGCMIRFTNGQIDRMHTTLNSDRQEIWSSANIANTGGGNNVVMVGGNIDISGIVTWSPSTFGSNEILIDGDLRVLSNSRFRISNLTVRFCDGSKILVSPGGFIIVENRTNLTAHQNQWEGIDNFGRVAFIGRSSLEKAKIGVNTFNEAQTSLYYAQFTDNKIGLKYNNNSKRTSIGNAIFTNSRSDFDCFIEMDRAGQIDITESQFINSIINENTNYTGIKATSSYFTVDKNSVFSKLNFGIYASTSSSNQPFNVRKANFDNCYYGIYVDNVHFPEITHSKFKIEQNFATPKGIYYNNNVLQS